MNENSNPGNMGQMPAGGGSGTQNDNTQYVGGPTGPSAPHPLMVPRVLVLRVLVLRWVRMRQWFPPRVFLNA